MQMGSGMKIELIRTSASRSDLLIESTKALRKFLKFDGEIVWHLHEDILNQERSNQCINYAMNCGLYKNVFINNPAIGQGHSLTKLLFTTTSKYILNFEDDFKPVREIDLNLCVEILEKFEKVNQICFHKRQTMSEKPGFQKKEVIFTLDDGREIVLTTNPHWALIPALWRADWIKQRWVDFEQGGHWSLNDSLKGGKLQQADWVIENTGTYYMGKIGENQYTDHMGADRSLRDKTEQGRW